MCSRSLIILVLGCALASANPIQENGNLSPQQGNNADIGSWLNDAHYGIRKSFKHTVKPFAQLYDTLVEASNVPEYSKDKIEELRILFHEIIDKSRENLSDIENAILTNTIVNLQRAAEFLSTRSNQIIQPYQHVLHKGNQNLQEIINNQANNANKVGHTVWSGFSGVGQKVQGMVNSQVENVKDGAFYYKPGKVSITDKLGGGVHDEVYRSGVENTKKEENEKKKKSTIDEDAGFFSNLGNTVRRAVDGGVEDVKRNLDDWGNNWAAGMKAGQDLFSSFGDKAQETLNNGKNTIGSGMENLQGNFNEWGSKGYEIAQGFNNIGNQAQDTFGNGFNGVQNQFNQNVPGNNNIGGGYEANGNVFDSRQALNNIGKQLAQAIAIQMSEIEKSLYEWKNLVESFLSNGESNLEKQPRELHEGINVLGSIGYMPSIDEGIEVPKNPIEGIFGNFGKKLGGKVGSGVDQFTGGYLLNIDEGKKDKKDSDDGIFSKIGQNVGGNMGSGVDKFTGAVGGFFNNAGKLFG